MRLQVKDVLSPNGFLYMVTVMDNDPEEILQLLRDGGIHGSYSCPSVERILLTCNSQEHHLWHAHALFYSLPR